MPSLFTNQRIKNRYRILERTLVLHSWTGVHVRELAPEEGGVVSDLGSLRPAVGSLCDVFEAEEVA
jgi:hypothetical protein